MTGSSIGFDQTLWLEHKHKGSKRDEPSPMLINAWMLAAGIARLLAGADKESSTSAMADIQPTSMLP
jgi:hypothetical protein